MNKDCHDCSRYGADDCPNSKECYSTNDKPYFKKRAMKPIYIFGRKKIRKLESKLLVEQERNDVYRNRISALEEYVRDKDELIKGWEETANSLNIKCKKLDDALYTARYRIEELKSKLPKAQPRDSKGRFIKKTK